MKSVLGKQRFILAWPTYDHPDSINPSSEFSRRRAETAEGAGKPARTRPETFHIFGDGSGDGSGDAPARRKGAEGPRCSETAPLPSPGRKTRGGGETTLESSRGGSPLASLFDFTNIRPQKYVDLT